ncbi:MAG: hypothetical protein V1712_02585 [Patescibacteria group bacterium]
MTLNPRLAERILELSNQGGGTKVMTKIRTKVGVGVAVAMAAGVVIAAVILFDVFK